MPLWLFACCPQLQQQCATPLLERARLALTSDLCNTARQALHAEALEDERKRLYAVRLAGLREEIGEEEAKLREVLAARARTKRKLEAQLARQAESIALERKERECEGAARIEAAREALRLTELERQMERGAVLAEAQKQ
eukprot:SAG11_NODE_17687_length_511_cov_1.237864_1_plen_139_part_10